MLCSLCQSVSDPKQITGPRFNNRSSVLIHLSVFEFPPHIFADAWPPAGVSPPAMRLTLLRSGTETTHKPRRSRTRDGRDEVAEFLLAIVESLLPYLQAEKTPYLPREPAR